MFYNTSCLHALAEMPRQRIEPSPFRVRSRILTVASIALLHLSLVKLRNFLQSSCAPSNKNRFAVLEAFVDFKDEKSINFFDKFYFRDSGYCNFQRKKLNADSKFFFSSIFFLHSQGSDGGAFILDGYESKPTQKTNKQCSKWKKLLFCIKFLKRKMIVYKISIRFK